MTARYPSQFPLFQLQTDGVDGVNAVDVNVLYEEVDAIAAELGLSPSSSSATVASRIAAIESAASSYVSVNGGSVVEPTAAVTKGVIIKGHASQSANHFEVKDNSNNILFSIGSAGALTFSSSIDGGGAF